MDARDFKDLHWLLDIIQSSNIGIVVLDRTLQVEVFNRFMQAHSGIPPEHAIGQPLCDLFPELSLEWLERRARTVFELGVPVYTTWEERPWLFRFELRLPLHPAIGEMCQNVMLVPLRGVSDRVERLGIVVYDVTESALARRKLEAARSELQKLSRTDALTGLCNRGYWEEQLQAEWRRAQRTHEPLSLVMFDIDHFKNINDQYGHPVGDEVIRLVALLLQQECREIDISGRYGGEEFAVILPETPEEGALVFCERLRQAIEAQRLETPEGPVAFTVSLGIAGWTSEMESTRQWLECADQALYQAKNGGRNQARVYQGEAP
jgi:diguanylate cyclase (GGDEF)-like protein